jgi:acetyl esterase/lipase
MTRTVTYGPLARHRLDVFPAKRGSAPVVLFLHGGSWQSGRRGLYGWLGRALAAQGFTAVIPDYRLHPEVVFPAFMEDAARAFAWITERAADHGGDPAIIHVTGHSAGGHMAALLALDDAYLSEFGLDPGRICSVAALAGPHSTNPLEVESVRAVFAGTPDIARARPVKLARGDAPPILLQHGSRDATVHERNSRHLHAAVTDRGGRCRLIVYPGLGHIEILMTLTPLYRWRAPVFRDLIGFLREEVP